MSKDTRLFYEVSLRTAQESKITGQSTHEHRINNPKQNIKLDPIQQYVFLKKGKSLLNQVYSRNARLF